MSNDKVSRVELLNQLKLLTKQNEHLTEQLRDMRSAIPTLGVMTDKLQMVLPHKGKFYECLVSWNLDTEEAKVIVGKEVTEDLFRAKFEGKNRLEQYYRDLRNN
jgi:hypothetical protein